MPKKPVTVPPSPKLQWINRHIWLDGCDLQTELRQAREEGRDLRRVEAQFKRLLAVPPAEAGKHQKLGGKRDEKWWRAAGALVDRVQALPYRKDFPYHEPSDLKGIKAARPRSRPALPKWPGDDNEKLFLEKLHGGLLGRICGCMLGKPVEGWWRDSIRISAEATGNWPLRDYFRLPTPEEEQRVVAQKPRSQFRKNWTVCLKDGIDGMVEDDDTNYTTIGFAIVKQRGKDFTPQDVASFWCDNVPIMHTCTAERAAYRNFVSLIAPPDSAAHRNPYREWIGAQIRADYFGYANPGDPERAAEWAWRDACISHIKNGIYGEMWAAAMLAAAYVESDWVKIIRAGLGEVPARCRLREDVEKVIAARAAGRTYDEAVALIRAQWDETIGHHWCHTNSNAQIVAAALLYGEDDYAKTISRAVMPGFDTDCNGATAGSVWGVRFGVSALPAAWTAPIKDRLRTGVHGYHDVSIAKLAEEMVQVAVKARG